MKLHIAIAILAVAFFHNASASIITGTFTAFGGGYDKTGHVTGFQGNGPVGGRWITGQFSLDLNRAPTDSAANSVRGLYQGNGIDWIRFCLDDLALPTLSDVSTIHGDRVELQLASTNVYQVLSDEGLSATSETDSTRVELRLRTEFIIHAPSLFTNDALAQTMAWREDDSNYYEYYDYGRLDVYYRLYVQRSDGTILADEYALQRFFITELNTVLTAVPVPAAAWLLGSGLLAVSGVARRPVRNTSRRPA